MAYMQYLILDGLSLPMPVSYEVEMKDVEADANGKTEAGTMQRDIIRTGVHTISVSFSVSPKWLQLLTQLKQKNSIQVSFFDTESLAMKTAEMFMDGYKATLIKDTSYKGLWKVSFQLYEL